MKIQPLIEFHDVSVTRGDKKILQDISFSLYPGEKIVLSGPSGSGKSSVLHVLLGFLPLSRGTVRYNGEPLSAATSHRLRQTTATVLQEPVPGGETVMESLLLPFAYKCNRHRTPDRRTICEVLATLGLPEAILEHQVTDISGGEKQRIALARALLLDRKLFVLDEITSALDAASKGRVAAALARTDLTILSVAHDPVWIARCNRIIRMEDGRIAGTMEQQPVRDNDGDD